MNVPVESIRALERHFVGALSLPPRLWLDAAPLSHLVVTGGAALRAAGDGCSVDFGTVESPGTERQVVRFGGDSEPLAVEVVGAPPWLAARLVNAATLELTATHDVLETTHFSAVVAIAIRDAAGGEQRAELLVRMIARRTHPLGSFDFHGSMQPRGLDFGVFDPLAPTGASYELSIGNRTSVPLTVAFSDLPAWLTFHVDGHLRVGPAPGRFFERAAPFKISIRPHPTTELIGAHAGTLRLETNDPRAELRAAGIRFAVRLEPAVPFLRAFAGAVRAETPRPIRSVIRLENWGRQAARITSVEAPPSVRVPDCVSVPAASGGRAGVASVPLRVIPTRLAPGVHSLLLTFAVEDGPPVHAAVPVEVMPAAARAPKGALAPAAMAALFTLLALTLLVVVYVQVVS
jgi:hypothetical protein